MVAYYNEIDPFAAQWLGRLIAGGHIAPGVVDTRSIEDVTPSDLEGFTQCHFFAGIGVWSYALRQAGWDDDRPVWTGSCPCQPFSAAGKGGGFADERHLWPAWFHLIEQCDPAVVIGEQVASKDGLAWLDLVRADMEGTGRAFGAADLCAAGLGAPHIRQRSWWVGLADAADQRRFGRRPGETGDKPGSVERLERLCNADRLADAQYDDRRTDEPGWGSNRRTVDGGSGQSVRLDDDDDDARLEGLAGHGVDGNEPGRIDAQPSGYAPASGGVGGLADTDGRNARAERQQRLVTGDRGDIVGLGDPRRTRTGRDARTALGEETGGRSGGRENGGDGGDAPVAAGATIVGLADTDSEYSGTERRDDRDAGSAPAGEIQQDDASDVPERYSGAARNEPSTGPTNGFWRDADWLYCRDGKWRPVEPGTFPLVNGAPNRVGRLRGYGNAIAAPVAQAFVEAVMSCL